MINKTKIVATLGPASQSEQKISRLIKAGMSVVRLNFSHGNDEGHQQLLSSVRKAAKKLQTRIAVIQDLPGPKIRTGDFENGSIELIPGNVIELTSKRCIGTAKRISINYPKLADDVKKGAEIVLNDGQQVLEVISIENNIVTAQVLLGGTIVSRRGVHIRAVSCRPAPLPKRTKNEFYLG